MTKKTDKDESDPQEPVLGTGAHGDPSHPDDVTPPGFENIPKQELHNAPLVTEAPESSKKKEDDK